MKHYYLVTALLFSISTIAQTNTNTVHVKPYPKKDGTTVQGHDRTAPNNTNRDNYSTRPNINPETGKKGTIRPDNKPTPSRR